MSATVLASILLVEHEEERKALFGGWLQDAGYDVFTCPGPSAPGYVCVGSRAGHCPLVDPASLVVLDLSVSPGAVIRPAVGVDLLAYYLTTGKPIIALGRGEDLLGDRAKDRVTRLERAPDRPSFLAAVRSLVSSIG